MSADPWKQRVDAGDWAAITAEVQSPSSGWRTVSMANACAWLRVCHSSTGEE